MSDADVKHLVMAAGRAPDGAFRANLAATVRAALADNAVNTADDIVSDTVTVRPLASVKRRRWPQWAAAAAVLALLVGGIAVLTGDRRSSPTDAGPLDSLTGRLWVAIDWYHGQLPYLRFDDIDAPPDRVAVTGYDGCNWLNGDVTITDGAIVESQISTTRALCAPRTAPPLEAGTALNLDGAGNLIIDGTRYVAFDTIPAPPSADLGAWDRALGTGPPSTPGEFGPAEFTGTATFESGVVDLDGCRTDVAYDAGRLIPTGDAPCWDTAEVRQLDEFTLILVTDGEQGPLSVERLTRPGDGVAGMLAGRMWVGAQWAAEQDADLDGAPWFSITSLSSERGALAISGFDGCANYEARLGLAGTLIATLDLGPRPPCEPAVLPAVGDNLGIAQDGPEAIWLDSAQTLFVDLAELPEVALEVLVGSWTSGSSVMEILAADQVALDGCARTVERQPDGRWRGVPDEGCSHAGVSAFVHEALAEGALEVRSLAGPPELLVLSAGSHVVVYERAGDSIAADGFLSTISDRVWVLESSEPDHPYGLRPTLTITGESPSLRFYNGCQWGSSDATFEVGANAVTLVAVTASNTTDNACLDERSGPLPAQGAVLALEDGRLVVTQPNGVELRYVDLADDAALVTPGDLIEAAGRWHLDDTAVELMITGSGITVNDCTVQTRIMAGGRLDLGDWPRDPYSCMLTGPILDETSSRLAETFFESTSVMARLAPDGTLWLSDLPDRAFSFRLTRVDWANPTFVESLLGTWTTDVPTGDGTIDSASLTFTRHPTNPGLLTLDGHDGCNSGGGVFTLDLTGRVIGSAVAYTEVGCSFETPVGIFDGVRLTIDGDTLTVNDGQRSSTYTRQISP